MTTSAWRSITSSRPAIADWGLRLGTALFRFWETREHLTEGRSRIARLLAMEGASRVRSCARACCSLLRFWRASRAITLRPAIVRRELETCLELDDNRGVAVALNALAVNARDRGELAAASLLFERCVAIWKDLGDSADMARAISNLANVMKLQGDSARASSLYDECLAHVPQGRRRGRRRLDTELPGRRRPRKKRFVRRPLVLRAKPGGVQLSRDGWGIASALSDLAGLSWDQGDNDEARRLYGESIRMFQNLGHKRGIARVLECLAANAAAQSNAEQSLHLAGAAAALRQRLGAPLTPAEQHEAGEGTGIRPPNAGQRRGSDGMDGRLGDASGTGHPGGA